MKYDYRCKKDPDISKTSSLHKEVHVPQQFTNTINISSEQTNTIFCRICNRHPTLHLLQEHFLPQIAMEKIKIIRNQGFVIKLLQNIGLYKHNSEHGTNNYYICNI